ncbi:hypothetical protein [Nocardioides perillae]|uniref:Putative membrane protein (TIGR04086 family) n=1 Tax=Nocardioides perillae TaxID=1119534 RepID=A0A7Y9RY88_9ACTN|nr:hypothetical protein [Nocardioides perillae]NYG56120.1 putative membrane protein (TIGR04086 family) [Nocardioides perillae]
MDQRDPALGRHASGSTEVDPDTRAAGTSGATVPAPRRHGAPLHHDVEARQDDAVVVRAGADADRHRGLDLPAVLGAVLAAFGALVILAALAGALLGAADSSVAGIVGGVLAVALACLVGGWVAGRAARHRGGVHGLLTALGLLLLLVALAALAAALGDRFDVVERLGLGSWSTDDVGDDLRTAAIVGGIAALLLAPLAAWLGGKLGERSAQRATVDTDVRVVTTRRGVRHHDGGIGTGTGTTTATTAPTATTTREENR